MIREFITLATIPDDYDVKNSGREELIRCKDCKYKKRCHRSMIVKTAYGGEMHMPFDGNGYCSAGEREEE